MNDSPGFIDEAQTFTRERMVELCRAIEKFGREPSYVHVHRRHRWIARWTTRTGKAFARRLWGAA